MSLNTNSIVLVGSLGRDPEGKAVGGDKFVTNFFIAVNGFKDDDPDWFNCQVWGKTAEFVANNVTKGMKVVVTGRMTFDKWVDKESGEKCSRPMVKASGVEVLFSGGGKSGGGEKKTYTKPASKADPRPAAPSEAEEDDSIPF